MFKKPRRNIRQRKGSENDENEGEFGTDTGNGSLNEPQQEIESVKNAVQLSSKKKSAPTLKIQPVAVSFGAAEEDEEESAEVFKVKKTTQSKKLSKLLKKERKNDKDTEKENLSSADGNDPDTSEEGLVFSGDRALDMELDSDVEGDGDNRETTQSHHVFKSVLERGEIPDANMIHLAKKKRALAREQGDVILLDDTVKLEKPVGSTARLVREDDNDMSEDEEERVDFSLNVAARERQLMKDNFLAAEHGSDESEHGDEWEQQQIRKVVKKEHVRLGDSDGGDSLSNQLAAVNSHSAYDSSEAVLRPLPDTISVDQIKKQLRERLESLQQVHRVHTQEKQNVAAGLAASRQSAETLENRSADGLLSKLNAKYTFYQELRAYVRDLLECFSEKFDQITALDSQMMTIHKNLSEKLCKRRQDDIRDEMSDCGSLTKPPIVIPETPVEKRQHALKQRRTADREARRMRRRRVRVDEGSKESHNDGMSSDDEESTSDVLKFNSDREKVISEARNLFDDVLEEFSCTESILAKFQTWKTRYGSDYDDAYVGLCLPKLLSPLVKLSLIEWNPLHEQTRPLSQMLWFKPVVLFGSREVFDSADLDNQLLPSIAEKVLIPKLTGFVDLVWDPVSTRQTRCLKVTLEQLVTDYPTLNESSKNTEHLIRAVVTRITKSLNEDVFMPLFSPDLMAKSSDASAFLHRQFWCSVKLLQNILQFSLILSDQQIKVLALDSLLNRYIMLGLQCAGTDANVIKRIKAITDALPSHWFRDLDGDGTLPQLENLCRFINMCAKVYYKKSETEFDGDRSYNRDSLKQLLRIMISIHALNHAKSLADLYSLRMPK